MIHIVSCPILDSRQNNNRGRNEYVVVEVLGAHVGGIVTYIRNETGEHKKKKKHRIILNDQ